MSAEILKSSGAINSYLVALGSLVNGFPETCFGCKDGHSDAGAAAPISSTISSAICTRSQNGQDT